MVEPTGPSLDDRMLFRPFLQPGEKVIWSGRPGKIRWFGRENGHWAIATFTLLWLLPSGVVGAIIGKIAIESGWKTLSHEHVFVALFAYNGLVLAVMAALIVWRVVRLRRAAYVLTDSRAMKIERIEGRPRSTSTALHISGKFDVKQRRNGGGDIVFGYRSRYVTSDDGGTGWIEDPNLTFEDISDVRRVLSLAQEALAKLGFKPVS